MSIYRFVKDSDTSGPSKRLFLQGTSSSSTSGRPQRPLGPPIVTDLSDPKNIENLQAIYKKQKLSTEVLGSSIESTRTSRNNEDGTHRITTRIYRKVTTLTRGEEKSVTEDLTRRGNERSIKYRTETADSGRELKPVKRVKVRRVCVLFCTDIQVK